MTVEEMHSWFDLIQDKVDTVYFTTHDKDMHINRAIQTFINNLIHRFKENPNGELVISSSLEISLNVAEVLRPITLQDLSVASDSAGLVTDAVIISAIDTKAGTTGNEYSHILALSMDNSGTDVSVKYVKHNDFYAFEGNDFKKGSSSQPRFRISSDGLYISPTGVNTFKITLIKTPDEVDYEAGTDTDLPASVHDIIMAYAFEFADVSSRDEALAKMRKIIA